MKQTQISNYKAVRRISNKALKQPQCGNNKTFASFRKIRPKLSF